MSEQQYKREIEEILRVADESDDINSTDTRVFTGSMAFKFYATKFKSRLKLSIWPVSPGLILLVSLITLLSSIVLRFVLPSVAQIAALGSLLIFILGYATFFVTKK